MFFTFVNHILFFLTSKITLDSIKDNLVSLNSSDSETEDENFMHPKGSILNFTKNSLSHSLNLNGISPNVFQGSIFWKIPSCSAAMPRKRWFRIEKSGDNIADVILLWSAPSLSGESNKGINLSLVSDLVYGHTTKAFKDQIKKRGKSVLPPSNLCFSLILENKSKLNNCFIY